MTGAIRTGLIGYGLAGQVFHAPLIAANDAFALTHIVTSNPARQAQAQERYPAVEILDSVESLWRKAPELDLVVIASPPAVHLEQALAAMAVGCAVVVDKPFVLTAVEADRMLQVGSDSGRPLIIFQNRRWDGDYLTVRRLVSEGHLGSIHTFTSTFERSWPLQPGHWRGAGHTAGAGILFDIGTHLIDQALELFGDVEEVSAELRIVDPNGESDDSAFVSLTHRSGVNSHLSMSRVAALGAPRFRILGDRGAYRVEGIDRQEQDLSEGRDPRDPVFGTTGPREWGTASIDGLVSPYPTEKGDYPGFYAGVAASLLSGQEPPVTPDIPLQTLRIVEYIYRTVPLRRMGVR